MRVGFIGLGEIGGPMAANLLKHRHSVDVYARRHEVSERYAALGARVVDSPIEVGRDAEVVMLCLYTDEQIQAVALDDPTFLAGMRPGSALVLHTTGCLDTARRLAKMAAPLGIDVIDAPVSGSVADVTAGQITLLVGGPAAAVRRVAPALSSYADPILHLGAVGTGQAAKLVNNALLAVNVLLLNEAERIARSLGMEPGLLVHALVHASGRSHVAEVAMELGSIGAMTEFLRPFLRKDIAVVREVADEVGSDLGLLGKVLSSGEDF